MSEFERLLSALTNIAADEKKAAVAWAARLAWNAAIEAAEKAIDQRCSGVEHDPGYTEDERRTTVCTLAFAGGLVRALSVPEDK